MRYRPLGPDGDYTVGVPFLINTPQTVAQAVSTRLKLWMGEWFMDTSDGTPWQQNILGPRAGASPDAYIKQRILGTPGVTQLTEYNSVYDGNGRTLTVTGVIDTLYGSAPISVALNIPSI